MFCIQTHVAFAARLSVKASVQRAQKRSHTLKNRSVKDVESRSDIRKQSFAMTVQSRLFAMNKGEVFGYIKDRCDGPFINSNITIEDVMGNFTQKKCVGYTGTR